MLTDEWQLRDEGSDGRNLDGSRGLWHCVGGYGPECRSGRTRIVSVRRLNADGTFDRLSTAELTYEGGDIVLRQHRGEANRPPPDEALGAVSAYVKDIADGKLGVDPRAFVRMHEEPGQGGAGYDWSAPGAWEAVSALWQPFLPRTLRGLSPADWDAFDMEVADVADDGSPVWRPLPWERVVPGPDREADVPSPSP